MEAGRQAGQEPDNEAAGSAGSAGTANPVNPAMAVNPSRPTMPTMPRDSGTLQNSAGKSQGFFVKFRDKVLHRFDAVPLSTKLVACTLVLLMVGTFGISLTIRQLVGSYLLGKTDEQLRDQAQLVYSNVDLLSQRDNDEASVGPNDYFMQIRDVNDNIVSTPLVPVLRNGIIAEPVLPANGSKGKVQLGKPFTTSSKVRTVSGGLKSDNPALQTAQAPWRVLALEGRERGPDGSSVVKLTVYIGVSLGDQYDIIKTLTQYSVLVSIVIVLFGAIAATIIIQRTLLPLKRIEKTAAKIAAGDLSQRVPTMPENTEVGSLAASLNAMLGRIEQGFREQQESTEKMKRFVSDASHELRTPLATIHGYSELYSMQRDLPGALKRADESIEHIEASSSRMTLLVEDLLSLARLDEGRGIDITQEVKLEGLLGDAADDLHALDPKRGIRRGSMALEHGQVGPARLSFTQGDLPHITLHGDGSRLRQVITNIVGNIHRYTASDSPVEIGMGAMPASISPTDLEHLPSTERSLHQFLDAVEVGQSMRVGMNYAVFSFMDHGPGVPTERQAQIFERFYTADPSRARQKGGTGLGMSIAQSVVRAHHGLIAASNTPGGGLTLTVILPIAPVEPPLPDEIRDGANGEKHGKSGRGGRGGRGGRSGRNNHAGRAGRTGRGGRSRKADRSDKAGKAAKATKDDNAGSADNADTSNKTDKTARKKRRPRREREKKARPPRKQFGDKG
ncbi:HAMP domain-containing sensor histidine kinase [Bifidobacterium sp. ESL0790]|uniref:sensor histidine kinase n=1 Tax=Bifidobacterium sp. ESL0790 TaxID=2983233 RepID=UPI0023F8EAED|nr:HAMP domain-containing sensor histidine kinase [Bifidobacterium sp. ESL0790]WEV71855.1 HAMP domain-containing sensor histidine kinase [Bifidobacterium sp. ESL0790]